MPLDCISIETLKQHLDDKTYFNIAKKEAVRKASIFKYIINVNKKVVGNEVKFYLQLKGTIGYSSNKKLWVTYSIGYISYDELKELDKQKVILKYENIMHRKARAAILNQFLK